MAAWIAGTASGDTARTTVVKPTAEGRKAPKSHAILVSKELIPGLTIDVDPTNGGILLDASELGTIVRNSINKEQITDAVLEVMLEYQKHKKKQNPSGKT